MRLQVFCNAQDTTSYDKEEVVVPWIHLVNQGYALWIGYYPQSNQGQPDLRNAGISQGKGLWLMQHSPQRMNLPGQDLRGHVWKEARGWWSLESRFQEKKATQSYGADAKIESSPMVSRKKVRLNLEMLNNRRLLATTEPITTVAFAIRQDTPNAVTSLTIVISVMNFGLPRPRRDMMDI